MLKLLKEWAVKPESDEKNEGVFVTVAVIDPGFYRALSSSLDAANKTLELLDLKELNVSEEQKLDQVDQK